jgi:hypothetical protein
LRKKKTERERERERERFMCLDPPIALFIKISTGVLHHFNILK